MTRFVFTPSGFLTTMLLTAGLLASACTPPSAPAAQVAPSASAEPPSPVAEPSETPMFPGLPPGVRVEFVTPTPDMDPPPPNALKLVVQPGSQARYRAQELMLGRNFMTDAIGSTDQVEGTIYVRQDGTPVLSSSLITVNLQGLKSDEKERDDFIKDVTLETDRFPQATFVPTETLGVPKRVTDNQGPITFRMAGQLTIHGVTNNAVWAVDGTISGSTFTGTATTTISLQSYGMTAPQVPIVLGVDDNVRLDLAFTMLREQD